MSVYAAELFVNGSKVQKVESITVSESPSGSIAWAARVYGPSVGMSDTLKPEKTDPKGTPSKTATIKLYKNNGSITFTDLIIVDRDLNVGPDGEVGVTISGKDYSELLNCDNQEMATFEHKTAYEIITTILETYGVSNTYFYGSLSDHLQNFPVPQLDFQRDKPINRIQTLLNEVGAYWRMDGKVFTAWIPDDTDPVKKFREADVRSLGSYKESCLELYDKVTVVRLSRSANIAGQQSGTSVGRTNTGLSGTFYSVQFRVIKDSGVSFSNVDWFYQNAYVGQGFNILGPVDQVYFTLTGSGGATTFDWEVKITGTPAEYLGSGVDLNTKLTKTKTGTDGKHPAPDIESSFVPNNTIAEIQADAFLRGQGKKLTTASFDTTLQIPRITIQDRIALQLPSVGITTAVEFDIESISRTAQTGEEITESYTLRKVE